MLMNASRSCCDYWRKVNTLGIWMFPSAEGTKSARTETAFIWNHVF